MTQHNFIALDDNDLDLVCGGGVSVGHIELTNSSDDLDIATRMTSGSTDSGSVGNIALNTDPNGPQSQTR